jgi:hypothetical protein
VLELGRTPNPPGSPVEKLTTEAFLEHTHRGVGERLGDPVTGEGLAEAIRFYLEQVQSYLARHLRLLEQWANVHRHQ